MLVTSGELMPTLAKLLLFDLHHVFDLGDVYSSSGESKLVVFARVAQDLDD